MTRPPGRLDPASRWTQNVALVIGAAAGLALGRGMSIIPSPTAVGVFWVGNLCAPWLVIAFLAGRAQRTWTRSALAGMITEIACVIGFYGSFLFLGPTALGLPPDTALANYAAPALLQWLRFIAFWLLMALASGSAYGLLGRWWQRSAPIAGALAVGLPFVVEPALWTARRGHLQSPWALWAAEILVGLVLTFVLLRRSAELRSDRYPSGGGPDRA
jgi:hypothetical protein